jgi:hypothetical protein
LGIKQRQQCELSVVAFGLQQQQQQQQQRQLGPQDLPV